MNPTPYIARLYLRQTFDLGGDKEWATDDVNQVADCMGPSRVVFGSDWPHIEALPEPLDYLRELKEFDAAEQRQILFENVQELLTLRPT